MNLSEVLNVALPELPARKAKLYPRIHPGVIMREHIEAGEPKMLAIISGGSLLFRFDPAQWELAKLFDGERSYEEIAELFTQNTGAAMGADQVREFAETLDDVGFWYKTPLEKNITATQKLADGRQRRVKKKKIDLSLMTFSSWDPDRYLTRLHNAIGFVYSKWFTYATLGLFGVMVLIFMGGWHEIWADTARYYSFNGKGALDIAEFWLLFCGLGWFHETAHGLTCKHFGGEAHQMGFMLVYLSPAFFVDVTEVYVYGTKWQRAATVIAGIWIELIFCSFASIVWWGTPPGSPVHDFAYKIMMITGVAVVVMNLNPLMKLDGYYLFSELVEIQMIKETSTDFVSSWVKRNILGLPVEVPYFSRRRRWILVIYAILSGIYSYVVLFAIVRFSYNVLSRFTPQWAFIPALGLAFLILRVRLRSSVRLMKDLYVDKKDAVRAWWTLPRKLLVGAAALIALFAPIWRQTVEARFYLEALQRSELRASIPGEISSVFTDEGKQVDAGAPIVQLRSVTLQGEQTLAQAELRSAEARARSAQLNYADFGSAQAQLESQSQHNRSVSDQGAALTVSSPISGVVVSPGLRNRVGTFALEGTVLAEVDDVRTMKAQIFVPDFLVRKIRPGAEASLKLEATFQPIRGYVSSMGSTYTAIAPGLVHEEKYQGIGAPNFYIATVLLNNLSGVLRPGMSGDAKILVARRSLSGMLSQTVREFVQRKVW